MASFRRGPGSDLLGRFHVTALRNLLVDISERVRVTARRSHEYEYEYGMPLIGRALPAVRAFARRARRRLRRPLG